MSTPSASNHLADQASLYLRQHADNPVHWFPWGEEALLKAKREDKPIFLSIGYSSCHWCHVMEEKVFEDAAIADFLNEHYVSIKVDREERPDLDRIYMEAITALTRSGGWPMSVWLTPTLRPFFGGTYFPPETFLDVCQKLAAAWEQTRDQIEDTAGQLDAYIRRNPIGSQPEAITLENLRSIGLEACGHLDNLYGGFEGAMRFPTPVRYQFMLRLYRRTGELELSNGVRNALIAMASGGLQDHVGGGFHRYTVDAHWTIPHFEKMLYDNAQLASLFLEAAAVFDDKAVFGHVARRTLDFLLRDMCDPETGGFYGSWDADSDGEEGTFYVWTPEQLTAIVKPEDVEPLFLLMGVTPEGNFDHSSTVLTRRFPPEEVAARTGRPVEEMKTLVDDYRDALYEARERRSKPRLDKKVITSWNALAISAMAAGYRFFGETEYLEAAEKAADFLHANHRHPDGSLSRSSTEGELAGDGIIDDYSFLLNALLDLFNATGRVDHLEWAIELAGRLESHFRNDDGGYYHTPLGAETPLGRQVEIMDSVEPSGNAMALMGRFRLATMQADEEAAKQVRHDIEAFAELMKKAGLEMAAWLEIALRLSCPSYEVCIVGLKTGENGQAFATSEIQRSLDTMMAPFLEQIPIVGSEPDMELLKLLPVTDGRNAENNRPTAYVCQMGACQLPTNDPEVVRKHLTDTWKR